MTLDEKGAVTPAKDHAERLLQQMRDGWHILATEPFPLGASARYGDCREIAAYLSAKGAGDVEREIELNVKSSLRLAFRKALAELPEIAPPEIRSLLSGVHMKDAFFNEGKRLQCEHGTDAVAPRVEQECGAGAWSFMRQGVLAALASVSQGGEKGIEALAAFGHGTVLVDTGTLRGVPAVFVKPSPAPGQIGELATPEHQGSLTELHPDEFILTFPTDEQARLVADALVNRLQPPSPRVDDAGLGGAREHAAASVASTCDVSIPDGSKMVLAPHVEDACAKIMAAVLRATTALTATGQQVIEAAANCIEQQAAALSRLAGQEPVGESPYPWESVKQVPATSVVLGGTMLLDAQGACIGMVNVLNANNDVRVEVARALNTAGDIATTRRHLNAARKGEAEALARVEELEQPAAIQTPVGFIGSVNLKSLKDGEAKFVSISRTREDLEKCGSDSHSLFTAPQPSPDVEKITRERDEAAVTEVGWNAQSVKQKKIAEARIRDLEAEAERLRKALEPFAKEASYWDGSKRGDGTNPKLITATVTDLRNARDAVALSAGGKEDGEPAHD